MDFRQPPKLLAVRSSANDFLQIQIHEPVAVDEMSVVRLSCYGQRGSDIIRSWTKKCPKLKKLPFFSSTSNGWPWAVFSSDNGSIF
jgi:hypothetical protein